MNLFDSSALLVFLLNENGADLVEEQLEAGPSACCAANWSETAQKIMARGIDWTPSRGLLLDYDLRIEPVLVVDAEQAARSWRVGSGLSLADRLCLASAERLDAVIWTADSAWGPDGRIHQIR